MKKLVVILMMAVANISFASDLDSVRWIAQDYPPYSYIDKDHNNSGSVIELVGKILQKSGSDKTIKDIEIRTFSKFFVRFNDKQDTVFFPLAKIPKREKYFKWVGPIFIDKPVIFAKVSADSKSSSDKDKAAKKSVIEITKLEDVENYSIVGMDGYTGVDQIQSLNISIKMGHSNQSNLIKLKDDLVDLVVCDETAGLDLIKKLNMNEDEFKVVYRLDTHEMSFAFNKNTEDDILKQVQNLLKEVKTKDKK